MSDKKSTDTSLADSVECIRLSIKSSRMSLLMTAEYLDYIKLGGYRPMETDLGQSLRLNDLSLKALENLSEEFHILLYEEAHPSIALNKIIDSETMQRVELIVGEG